MNDDPDDKDNKDDKCDEDDLVLTPGGPRPRHLVNKIEDDEMLVYDEQGNPRVVPRQEDHKDESSQT
jgi:hypothetical protein